MAVYQTSTELFASSQSTPVGQLAFSVSSQQLYIRVNNGWREVNLGPFHSTLEQRPAVVSFMIFSFQKLVRSSNNDL